MELVSKLAESIGGDPITIIRSSRENVWRAFIAETEIDPTNTDDIQKAKREDALAIMEFVIPLDGTKLDDVEPDAKRWKHGREAATWHEQNGTLPEEGLPAFRACLMYSDARWMLPAFPLLNSPMDFMLIVEGPGEMVKNLTDWSDEKVSQFIGFLTLMGPKSVAIAQAIMQVRPVVPDLAAVQRFLTEAKRLRD